MYWTSKPQKPGWYIARFDNGHMALVHFHFAQTGTENRVKPGEFCYGYRAVSDDFPATKEWLANKKFSRVTDRFTEPLNG